MLNTENNKSIEEKLFSVLKKVRLEKNKKILLSNLDVILRYGRRNIPLRGSYDVNIHKDIGNFQHFVEWKAGFDQVYPLLCRKNMRYNIKGYNKINFFYYSRLDARHFDKSSTVYLYKFCWRKFGSK